MKITGVIEPGPKREVRTEYFTVTIENDVTVEWELDRDESGQIRWTPKAPSRLWNSPGNGAEERPNPSLNGIKLPMTNTMLETINRHDQIRRLWDLVYFLEVQKK
jgi:hypothetical protein